MVSVPKRYSLTVLFLVVLLCALIPLLGIYYTAHVSNARLLREEVTASLLRQNQDFSDRLQDDMSRIINTNYMLARNWELGKLAVVPDEFTAYEKSQAFQNIQDKIYLAQLTSRFIKDINVYFPILDKCLSTNSSPAKLTHMRRITAQLDILPQDQFFIFEGEMILINSVTFSADASTPNLVIQTTLSQRELLSFYQDIYWNELSSGTIMSLHNRDWPQVIEPDSLEALFYQKLKEELEVSNETVQEGRLLLDHEGRRYQLLYSYIPYADLILMRYYDTAQIESTFGFTRSMLVLFATVAALVFLLIYYALYRLVNRPLKTLTRAFSRVESGDLDFELEAEARGEFAFVYHGFSHMLSRLRVLIHETYLQGQMVRKAEFKQLQTQIDPHFLYNGFFILNKRIRAGDNDGALTFSKLLSDYFRYVTQNARDAVPLIEEVSHAYNYARIQQVRFANRLSLTLDPVPDEYAQLQIPRLVLQPIVENVFRHVLDGAEGVTVLRISYRSGQNGVEIWIEDSGKSLSEEKLQAMRTVLLRSAADPDDDKEVSGLTNVNMRLKLFWGENYGLYFDKSGMGGLLVRIRIPFRKEYPQ